MKPKGRSQGGQGAVKVERSRVSFDEMLRARFVPKKFFSRANEQYLDGSRADLKWACRRIALRGLKRLPF